MSGSIGAPAYRSIGDQLVSNAILGLLLREVFLGAHRDCPLPKWRIMTTSRISTMDGDRDIWSMAPDGSDRRNLPLFGSERFRVLRARMRGYDRLVRV